MPDSSTASTSSPAGGAAAVEITRALDHSPVTRRHRVFLLALLAALVFDYMKPYTISFVIPGMRAMWGLDQRTASYLAVAGLTGTAVGAIFWGVVADRIGRRAVLLWTVSIFTVSSLCGLSRTFGQALAACFVMGFGVGGEAPIVFALAAEYLPVSTRGRSVLGLGIVGAVGGYALAAGVAAAANELYPPAAAWRAMWLVNIVPALLILVLRSRIVPESARFLLARGRVAEAWRAAGCILGDARAAAHAAQEARVPTPRGGDRDRAGATMGTMSAAQIDGADGAAVAGGRPHEPLHARTAALALFSFAWGLASFGFVTWLPTLLGRLGYTGATASALLAYSALLAIPALAITVLLFTRWSTRWTLVLYAVLGSITLLALGAATSGVDGWGAPVVVVVVTSLAFFFVTAMGGAFSLYAAEVFPTALRARRSGLVAAAGRVGGVVGPYFGGVWLAAGGSALGLHLPLSAALAAAAVALAVAGIETRGRALEEI